MQYTGNLNLKKPDGADVVDIADLNNNSDIIDQQIKVAQDNAAAASSVAATHANGTNVHSATAAATANRIMMRDANGRAKVAAPSAVDDIARKDTVDAVGTNLTNHKVDTMPHIFTDGTKTYKYGFSVVNGILNFNYEEVI